MTYTNIYYFYYLSDIGGTETFLYELAKKYNQLDLTIIYRHANENQIKRLKQYVRCIQFKDGMKIQCERAFFNYGIDIIDSVEAKDYCFVIHADYEDMKKRGQLSCNVPSHPKLNKYIAVSERAAKGFQNVTGIKPEVCYNPFEIRQPGPVLNLISATRLSKEKGKNRMIELAKMLDSAGIKYIWTIFTNDTKEIDNPNVVYMKPRLDILDYIAKADYLVQLSDNEGFCYSVVEALCAGTPVIVTPCPVFDEIGLKDEKNCYIIPFDMKNFDVKKLLNIPKDFNYRPPQDNWGEILINAPSTWEDEQRQVYLVEALPVYSETKIVDGQLGFCPTPGYRWEVDGERARILTGMNFRHTPFVKVVDKYIKK